MSWAHRRQPAAGAVEDDDDDEDDPYAQYADSVTTTTRTRTTSPVRVTTGHRDTRGRSFAGAALHVRPVRASRPHRTRRFARASGGRRLTAGCVPTTGY